MKKSNEIKLLEYLWKNFGERETEYFIESPYGFVDTCLKFGVNLDDKDFRKWVKDREKSE